MFYNKCKYDEIGKDKIYLNKLEDAKKVIIAENQIKISQLEQTIKNLEKENLSNIKLKWQIFGFILGFAVIVILLFCISRIYIKILQYLLNLGF